MDAPALFTPDWGTSNRCARLPVPDAREIHRRSAPGGIVAVKDGRFSEALLLVSLVGDWVEKQPPLSAPLSDLFRRTGCKGNFPAIRLFSRQGAR
jgi:hypothetical protein